MCEIYTAMSEVDRIESASFSAKNDCHYESRGPALVDAPHRCTSAKMATNCLPVVNS